MRHTLLTLVLLLIAANVFAAIWIFEIFPGAPLPFPFVIFFAAEAVGFVIFLMLLPFIGGLLLTVFTIGAGVSVGNVMSDRIRERDVRARGLSLGRYEDGPEMSRGPQFLDLRPPQNPRYPDSPVLLPPPREASPCEACGHYLRATDRFCPGCGVAR